MSKTHTQCIVLIQHDVHLVSHSPIYCSQNTFKYRNQQITKVASEQCQCQWVGRVCLKYEYTGGVAVV